MADDEQQADEQRANRCPICGEPVEDAGDFCSSEHRRAWWQRWEDEQAA